MITTVTLEKFKSFSEPTHFALRPIGLTFLAGGNNSGKSTLLQALAVWEFGRSAIELSKGRNALLANATDSGVGISAGDFSPIALPSLKYLWSDLRCNGGYTLRVRCEWCPSDSISKSRYLEIAFSLAQDRLFVKRNASNLVDGDPIPRLAYLPPFAGIRAREERMFPATRRLLIGRGLAGSVLRNSLYDMWKRNADERKRAKEATGRISRKDLAKLRNTDAWEKLLRVLANVFHLSLRVRQLNEDYQTAIEILTVDVCLNNGRLMKKVGARKKT